MGLFIGTGDQDNYAKLVVTANGGSPGVQFVKEVGGIDTIRPVAPLRLPGSRFRRPLPHCRPRRGHRAAAYRVTAGGIAGPLNLGRHRSRSPPAWLTNATAGPRHRHHLHVLRRSHLPGHVGCASRRRERRVEPAPPDAHHLGPANRSRAPSCRQSPGLGAQRAAVGLPPGTWQTRAPASFARQEVSYVYVPEVGKFFLAGGMSTTQEAYDPSPTPGTTVAPLPSASTTSSPSTSAGSSTTSAGWPGGLAPVGTVSIYDPATDCFTAGTPMPAGRDRGAGGSPSTTADLLRRRPARRHGGALVRRLRPRHHLVTRCPTCPSPVTTSRLRWSATASTRSAAATPTSTRPPP